MQQPTAWLVGGLVRMTNATVCSLVLEICGPPELPYTSHPQLHLHPPPAYQSMTAGATQAQLQRAQLLSIHCIQCSGNYCRTMGCAACPIRRGRRTSFTSFCLRIKGVLGSNVLFIFMVSKKVNKGRLGNICFIFTFDTFLIQKTKMNRVTFNRLRFY